MTEIRNLDDLAAYAQEQVERITRMQQQLAEYEGAGESAGGLVRARTGPGGRLVGLRLDPEVMRMSPDAAAEEITAAVTAAQRDYASRADDIMAPVLAMRPGDETADLLDRGMRRLDALTDDLERLARRHGLDA